MEFNNDIDHFYDDEEEWNESLLDEPTNGCLDGNNTPNQRKCHNRSIIHIDIDCFYAQVEMIKNPELRDKPLGIKQKNLVVTTNYTARNAGVPKSCWIPEAMKTCPNLILINGEDLHDYRQFSQEIFDVLKSFKVPVEKLGMDENYMDVTKLVSKEVGNQATLKGHFVYSSDENVCKCGCDKRLKIASNIAQKVRSHLQEKLSITSSAGVAHNKLFAKMVGSRHKPNDQTTIFPCDADEFLFEIGDVKKLPGIGSAMLAKLKEIELDQISAVRQSSLQRLNEVFDPVTANKIWDFCHGVDENKVKISLPSKSIGVEDRFKGINNRDQSIKHLEWLLDRLSLLLHEDSRLPSVIRITTRDHNKAKLVNKFMRESRQSKILPELFSSLSNERTLETKARSKVLSIAVDLLGKMIQLDTTFHMTLLGISVTGFNETTNKNIASFFKQSVNLSTYFPCSSNSSATTSKKRSLPVSLMPDEPSPKHVRLSEEKSTAATQMKFFRKPTNSSRSSQNENIEIPSGWDKDVFRELPPDIQQELLTSSTQNRPMFNNNKLPSPKKGKPKKNSIYNYFDKN